MKYTLNVRLQDTIDRFVYDPTLVLRDFIRNKSTNQLPKRKCNMAKNDQTSEEKEPPSLLFPPTSSRTNEYTVEESLQGPTHKALSKYGLRYFLLYNRKIVQMPFTWEPSLPVFNEDVTQNRIQRRLT